MSETLLYYFSIRVQIQTDSNGLHVMHWIQKVCRVLFQSMRHEYLMSSPIISRFMTVAQKDQGPQSVANEEFSSSPCQHHSVSPVVTII